MSLGTAEAPCRPGEPGPAFLVDVIGLKDHAGLLKLEVYPANDPDFLDDDTHLVAAGKVFRRLEVPVPAEAEPRLCIRVPAPGTYALSLLHDRNSDHRFNWRRDGGGFSRNPRLGISQPRAAAVAITAGPGLTPVRIVLNYYDGWFSFRPLKGAP